MKIVIIGPQGSGKTTQAEILAKKLNLCVIEVGTLLRKMAEGKGKKSEEIRKELNAGDLIDDRLVARLFQEEVQRANCQRGFVTDGYPRTLDQHNFFDPGFDVAFYLKLSDEEAVKRLLKRGREDDTPHSIKERLDWYHKETTPLLDYYRQQGILAIIDGDRSIEDVASQILKKLRMEGVNEC